MPWVHELVIFKDLKLHEAFRQEFEGTVQVKWYERQIPPDRSVHRLTFVPDDALTSNPMADIEPSEPDEPDRPTCPRCGGVLTMWSVRDEGNLWGAVCATKCEVLKATPVYPTRAEAIAAQAQRVSELKPAAEPELLPCPFCGGDDIHVEAESSNWAWVECHSCGAKGSPGRSGYRERWNRRADGVAEHITELTTAEPCSFCDTLENAVMMRKAGVFWVGCPRCGKRGPLATNQEAAVAFWERAERKSTKPAAPDAASMELLKQAETLQRYANDTQRIAARLHQMIERNRE